MCAVCRNSRKQVLASLLEVLKTGETNPAENRRAWVDIVLRVTDGTPIAVLARTDQFERLCDVAELLKSTRIAVLPGYTFCALLIEYVMLTQELAV